MDTTYCDRDRTQRLWSAIPPTAFAPLPLRTATVRPQAPAPAERVGAGDSEAVATGGQYIPFWGEGLQDPKKRGTTNGSQLCCRRCMCLAFFAAIGLLFFALFFRDRSTGHPHNPTIVHAFTGTALIATTRPPKPPPLSLIHI